MSIVRGVSLAVCALVVILVGVITLPGAPSSGVAYAAAPSPDDYTSDPQEMYHPTTYVVIGVIKVDNWLGQEAVADKSVTGIKGTHYGQQAKTLNHIVWWSGQTDSVTARVFGAQIVGENGLEWLETGFYPDSRGAKTETRIDRPTGIVLIEVPQSVALAIGATVFNTCQVLKDNTATELWETIVFPEFCTVAEPATP